MKTVLITSAFISICAIQAGAAELTTNQQGSGKNIELKKAEILQHIQDRITNSQAEIACVKAAQSHDELKACKEKYRPVKNNDKRGRTPQQ